MVRSSRLHANTFATLALTTVALGVACGSSVDYSSPPSNGGSSNGASGSGTSGQVGASGHGGASAGTSGSSGATAGGAGMGGSAGASTAGDAGSPSAGVGGVSGEAGANSGYAGASDGAAGEGGASSGVGHELVYVFGLGVGTSEFELDAQGKPEPLADGVVKSARGFPYAIAASPDQRFLYEVEDDAKLRTYALDDRGALSTTPISSVATSNIPEAIAVTKDGKFLYVGDAAGIDIYALDASTGVPTSTGAPLSLSVVVQALTLSPDGKTLYATQPVPGVRAFQVNPDTGALSELQGSPFVSTVFPRGGIQITPNGKFMYVSDTGLTAISIAESGALTSISTYTNDVLSDGYAPNVAITKDGRFVYATEFLTQQPDGHGFGLFSGFAIQSDGTLQLLPGFPMSLDNAYSAAVDPSSSLLFIGMDDLDSFAVFSIGASGNLSPLAGSPFTAHGFEPLFAFATRP